MTQSLPPPLHRRSFHEAEQPRGRSVQRRNGRDYSPSPSSSSQTPSPSPNTNRRPRSLSATSRVSSHHHSDVSNVDGVDVDLSFSQNTQDSSSTSQSSTSNTPKLKVKLKKRDAGNNSTIKPYHLVEWNGKKYRLTHFCKNGTQDRQNGFTEDHWEAIARDQIAIWNKAKELNPSFNFSNSSFDTETGNWKFREAASMPIQTIDFTASTSSSPYTAIQPIATKAQELFKHKKVKPHPIKFVRGNPPKPTLANEKKPKPPKPLPDPLTPPPPPPEEIKWWQIGKRFSSWWNSRKDSEN